MFKFIKKVQKSAPKQTTKPGKILKPIDKNKVKFPISIIFLLIIILASMATIAYFFTILPTKAENIKKIRSESLSSQISSQDEALLTQTLKDTYDQRQKLLSVFPREENLIDFIKIIDNLEKQDIEVVSFSVDSDVPTKIGNSQSFLPMTLILQGDKTKVYQALREISNSIYFIKTITMTVVYDPNSSQVRLHTQFHLFVADDF